MIIETGKDGSISRQQVWLTAWAVVAAAENCTDKAAPARWADRCLADFDERFPPTSEGEK